MSIRDLFDVGAPHAPASAAAWAEAISDEVDLLESINVKPVWAQSNVTAGQLLSIVGSAGAVSLVAPADKDNPPDGGSVDGIALETFVAGTGGTMQVSGVAEGLDTSGLTAGGRLWLGNNGGMVDVQPTVGTVVGVGKVGVVAPAGGTVVLSLPAVEVEAAAVTYDGTVAATRVGAALDELDAGKQPTGAYVESTDATTIVVTTKAAWEALAPPDPDTIYLFTAAT